MMIIENADRFGLAQLHQLRGRVGRGKPSRTACSSRTRTRPRGAAEGSVADLTDGFELAERDFELRREGDVLGFAQSGLPALRIASLTRTDHRDPAVRARVAAERLLDDWSAVRDRADMGALAARCTRLAAAARGGRPGERLVTPAGSSCLMPVWTLPEAGSVIRDGAAIRLEAPGAGTRPLADRVKQTSSRSWSRTCAARDSSTRSRGAAPVVSRRCLGAPLTPRSWSATPGVSAPSRTTCERAGLAGRTALWSSEPMPSAGCAIPPAPPRHPTTSSGRSALRRRRRLAAPSSRCRPCRPRRPCRGEALLADAAAGHGRAASIRARAPVRRDGADLLPAHGGRMSVAVYPGLVRPDHERPPRHRRTGRGGVRHRRRRRPRQPEEGAAPVGRPADRRHPRRSSSTRDPTRRSRSRRSTGSRSTSPGARRRCDRPRSAGDQRLRDRDAAGPQQPGPGAARSTPSSS